MKAKKSARLCFLSAPFGTNTRILERALEKRGFSIKDGRMVAPEAPLIEEIRRRIVEADLVCVVATSALSVNGAFEVGVAVGTAKQVIVFAPLGTAFPSDLLGIMYCSAALDDEVGIATFLNAFLAHGRIQRGVISPETEVHRLSKAQSNQLRRELASTTGVAFEDFVRNLFDRAGYVASESIGEKEGRVDFAVWVDSLQHAFGNPIVVEVKDRLNEASAVLSEETLRAAMQRTRSRLGLLVYRSSSVLSQRAAPRPSWPLVLRLEAAQLIKLLERGTLESELIQLRNRVVHGVEER